MRFINIWSLICEFDSNIPYAILRTCRFLLHFFYYFSNVKVSLVILSALICPDGFIVSNNATCSNTCLDTAADQSSDCNIFPHEACVCPEGKVLKQNQCVPLEQCVDTCTIDVEGLPLTLNVSFYL